MIMGLTPLDYGNSEYVITRCSEDQIGFGEQHVSFLRSPVTVKRLDIYKDGRVDKGLEREVENLPYEPNFLRIHPVVDRFGKQVGLELHVKARNPLATRVDVFQVVGKLDTADMAVELYRRLVKAKAA